MFDDEATETVEYILDDNNTLLGEIYTYTEADGYIETESIYYFYDESGSPVYCKYNGIIYYYVKNQQGDITGLMKSDGTMAVTYEYDAWGNIVSTSRNGSDAYGLYTLNVYTYRGYIYDIDTGFYYLQSRYYDPEVGRFLNADDTNYLGATGTTLGYNLYAYCENNAVNYSDHEGYAKWGLVAIGLQLEFNVSAYTHGYELIFTNNNGIKAYLFKYRGGSIGGSIIDTILSIAKGITKNWRNLFSMSLSLCFMAIFSTKKFDSITYKGYFDTSYLVTPGSILGWGINTKTFVSSFGNYRVVGTGFTNSGFDVGYSRVFYTDITYLLKSLGSYLNNIYNTIYNKVRYLKA